MSKIEIDADTLAVIISEMSRTVLVEVSSSEIRRLNAVRLYLSVYPLIAAKVRAEIETEKMKPQTFKFDDGYEITLGPWSAHDSVGHFQGYRAATWGDAVRVRLAILANREK